jgi:hypothetical protein
LVVRPADLVIPVFNLDSRRSRCWGRPGGGGREPAGVGGGREAAGGSPRASPALLDRAGTPAPWPRRRHER